MPVGLHDLQWYSHNSVRNYPLAESATCLDSSGSFQLPTSFLVGLHLPIVWNSDIDPASFYLSRINYFPASVQLTISCLVSTVATVVATAVVAFEDHVPNVSYNLIGGTSFPNTNGYVTIGNVSDMLRQPPGSYQFTQAGGRLDLDTIRPNIRGISAIQVESAGATSRQLQKVVRLVAGRNSRLTVIQEEDEYPIVVFNAIAGEGLTEDCECEDTSAGPIRTVNGVAPDSQGNLNLLGGSCIDVESQQFGLRLSNPCSSPCCGPEALEAITVQLESFGSKATTLENFLVRLEAESAQMNLTVLGSRLGDRGCTVSE